MSGRIHFKFCTAPLSCINTHATSLPFQVKGDERCTFKAQHLNRTEECEGGTKFCVPPSPNGKQQKVKCLTARLKGLTLRHEKEKGLGQVFKSTGKRRKDGTVWYEQCEKSQIRTRKKGKEKRKKPRKDKKGKQKDKSKKGVKPEKLDKNEPKHSARDRPKNPKGDE